MPDPFNLLFSFSCRWPLALACPALPVSAPDLHAVPALNIISCTAPAAPLCFPSLSNPIANCDIDPQATAWSVTQPVAVTLSVQSRHDMAAKHCQLSACSASRVCAQNAQQLHACCFLHLTVCTRQPAPACLLVGSYHRPCIQQWIGLVIAFMCLQYDCSLAELAEARRPLWKNLAVTVSLPCAGRTLHATAAKRGGGIVFVGAAYRWALTITGRLNSLDTPRQTPT